MEESKAPPYSRQTLIAFFAPFTVFGIAFSIIAIDHVAKSPCRDVPVDYVYAVFSGFSDIGVMFGIISLVIVSLLGSARRLLKALLDRERKGESA
ncbi:MAG: hypothetical protein IPM23_13120 [Candidatus Melainabacteria bacterium]|nr:hypothetical protein [Candidatus Melainabacteria bacterium]